MVELDVSKWRRQWGFTKVDQLGREQWSEDERVEEFQWERWVGEWMVVNQRVDDKI